MVLHSTNPVLSLSRGQCYHHPLPTAPTPSPSICFLEGTVLPTEIQVGSCPCGRRQAGWNLGPFLGTAEEVSGRETWPHWGCCKTLWSLLCPGQHL